VIEHFSTLFALCAQFATERQSAGHEATSEEFRKWLRDVAFPDMMQNSELALKSVVSMKAENVHQFKMLLSRLDDIEEAILSGGTDARSIWRALTDEDRQVLSYLASRCDEVIEVHLERDEACEAIGLDHETLERSARALSERGLVALHEHAGGWSLASTPQGHLLRSMVEDRAWAERAARALCAQLLNNGAATTVQTVADTAGVPVGRAFALLSNFADQGRLHLATVWPLSHTRVWGLAESLRRELASG
jgi:DNA-binding transcriptional ArsR family regulator